MKRRLKQEAKEKEKAAKEAVKAQQPQTGQTKQATAGADDEEIDPSVRHSWALI